MKKVELKKIRISKLSFEEKLSIKGGKMMIVEETQSKEPPCSTVDDPSRRFC